MITKRYFRYFDWINFTLTFLLLCIGILFVFSATYTPEQPISLFCKKQIFGAVSGLVIYVLFCIADLRSLDQVGFFGYFASLFLLVYTLLAGWMGSWGARRWISLFFFRFQPSELSKLFLPSFIGFYFFEQQSTPIRKNLSIKKFLLPLAALTCNFLLILKQPDLGTALILFFSGLIVFAVIGLDKKYIKIIGIIALVGSPMLWHTLKPYQQRRILVLLGYGNVHTDAYQIEQSKIALGSGGLQGKGLLQGTQNKLSFLPEDHTDFIFSVIGEEWGFYGTVALLILFCLLCSRILYIILTLQDLHKQVLALGLILPLMLSVCINTGMVTGILPTVGINLPLVSYGISNLWITLASLGWINNIATRRFYF